MQFSSLITLIALGATTISAMPAPVAAPEAVAMPGFFSDAETAIHDLASRKKNGCSIVKCLVALAPTLVTCAAAAAEEGVNVIEDAECLAEAVRDVVDKPEECAKCY